MRASHEPAYHIPRGDPCENCALPRSAHRVEHHPVGDPCQRCYCRASQHRIPRKRKDKRRRRGRGREGRPASPRAFIGIDGEGIGRDDHRYIMLARAGVGGSNPSCVEVGKGQARLTTAQCLDFILSCPGHARIFSFAFAYDLTHILRDLPDKDLYRLLRPELRQDTTSSKPRWKRQPIVVRFGDYRLNLLSRKFVVQRGTRRRVVWDIFQFYQSKFTTALERWKVGDPVDLDRMRAMKDQRGNFDRLTRDQVREYCLDECGKMAELAQKLLQAHNECGLNLKSYFGPGSSATVAMKRWKIEKQKRDAPTEVQDLAGHAFFGGRFEIARAGQVPGPVYSYDISSAYPYQISQLPCLECGQWVHTTTPQALTQSTTALVRYSLKKTGSRSWGPFPFRLDDGAIAFPSASGGGWLWQSEYEAGKKLFPGRVRFHEAWVYRTMCKHRPFSEIPGLYLERLRLGKEGPGLVLKLVINSVYGKLAQSVGSPLFQSWIWAGMITAGTRAQLLTLMGRHKSLDSVLMLATDGLASTERVRCPRPINTGTDTEHSKPLGGWERTDIPQGIFLARPGIYFPLNPTEADIAKVRARGVGRGAVLSQFQKAVDAFERGDASVVMAEVSRFIGAKSSVYKKGNGYVRSPRYGQWETKQIELSFSPMPKRATMTKDGRLTLRSFLGQESAPYSRSRISLETAALIQAEHERNEQPDGDDWTDYEGEPL